MYGLTLEQETALTICYMHQGDGNRNFSELGMSKAFIALQVMGMIKMTTDMSQHLVFFQGMLPAGAEHYDKARRARRRYIALDDSADELIMRLAVQDRALKEAGKPRTVSTNMGSIEDYQDLANAGLLNTRWADDKPYIVKVTSKGISYTEGWFENQMMSNISEPERMSYAPMFSLVIRADPNFPIDRTRLFEDTDARLSSQFMQGDTPNLADLIKIPAVLTREFQTDDSNTTAVLGYIDEPSLNPVISRPILTFPSKCLLDLGIIRQRWYNARTHWAICEGDPFKLFSPYAINQANMAIGQITDANSHIDNSDNVEMNPKFVAVMMPFKQAADRDPVYRAIKKACTDAGFICKRVDEYYTPGNIVDDITKMICSASIVIADLTDKNPNVMYEVGFAHGRNKQTVCIQEGNIDLPFDMGHNRTLTYARNDNGLNGLTKTLTLVIQKLSLSL